VNEFGVHVFQWRSFIASAIKLLIRIQIDSCTADRTRDARDIILNKVINYLSLYFVKCLRIENFSNKTA
jgi:hypothetical protein